MFLGPTRISIALTIKTLMESILAKQKAKTVTETNRKQKTEKQISHSSKLKLKFSFAHGLVFGCAQNANSFLRPNGRYIQLQSAEG